MTTIGSLFSGIGGLELGLERAGLGPVLWQCEIDPFCRAVLAKHWPDVTRFEDVREVGDALPRVDLLCGGFPCQDVSSAGKRRGLDGERSGLWYEFARIIELVRPSWVVVENVASGVRRWLPEVRRQLCELGYRTRAYEIRAADVGLPHSRARVFVVADSDGEGEPQSTRREPQERRRAVDRRAAKGWNVATEPAVGRVADGVPRRVDRLRSLGNAVVPQCAEVIGLMIQEMKS